MKLLYVLFLCIGFVQAIDEVVTKYDSTTVMEEMNEGFQLSPAWLDLKATTDEHEQSNQFLGSCRTCKKTYLCKTDCIPEYQNPKFHRNYQTKIGCEYTCCTDTKNDPTCCRYSCDNVCNRKYVLNGNCEHGYNRLKSQ
jgi:hypothetical protein